MRLNEENYNNQGTLMRIIEYKNAKNITVEFQDKHRAIVKTIYKHFKSGEISNPYDKTVYNVGCIGEGKYKASENRKSTKCYMTWKSMLQRCYDPYYINKRLTYIDCFVCEEWLNFQNFAKWYEENYYECNNERTELDKDILYKDNKLYSPETCCFVPQRINTLLTKSDKSRGEYPIGVSYYEITNELRVRCSIYENNKPKNKHLGCFPLDRIEDAFKCYKQFKENYIKQVADEYKDLIPKKLYKALYRWEVKIND